MGSLFRFHQEPMVSSSVRTVELPGAYLTVSQLTHGLKTFWGKFHSHNYFDDASVDNNSGNHLVVCEGSRRTCALLYEQRGPLGSRFYMPDRDKSIDTDKVVREFCSRPLPFILECHANTVLSLCSS